MTLSEMQDALDGALARMKSAHRAIEMAGPNDDVVALEREFDGAETQVRSLKSRIDRAKAAEAAFAATAEHDAAQLRAVEGARVAGIGNALEARSLGFGRHAAVYHRDARHSFFGDVVAAATKSDQRAFERLEQNRRAVEAPGHSISGSNVGSSFVVPELLLGDDYARVRDSGRPLANAIGARPLPAGVNEIRVPRVTAGLTAANQTEGQAYSTGDVTTAEVTAQVQAIGHYSDLTRQLLERSNPAMEEVLIADQLRAINLQLDSQLISGSGTSPQLRGIRNVSGIQTATYTDASPTVAEFLTQLGKAFATHVDNDQDVELVVMHPRRWSWLLSAVDDSNRPLVTPAPYFAQSQNPVGVSTPAGARMGPVGTVLGVPVVLDGAIPTTLGSGTNEDVVFVLTVSDMRLWEAVPVVQVLNEVLAHQGQVRIVTYVDAAFMAGRYPKATLELGGTGLVAPT